MVSANHASNNWLLLNTQKYSFIHNLTTYIKLQLWGHLLLYHIRHWHLQVISYIPKAKQRRSYIFLQIREDTLKGQRLQHVLHIWQPTKDKHKIWFKNKLQIQILIINTDFWIIWTFLSGLYFLMDINKKQQENVTTITRVIAYTLLTSSLSKQVQLIFWYHYEDKVVTVNQYFIYDIISS